MPEGAPGIRTDATVPPLGHGMVHLWLIRLPEHAPRADALVHLLDAAEQAKASRFHFAADRLRYIVAHGVLRLLLAAYVGASAEALEFECGAYGKPSLFPTSAVRFNLSHSGDYALIGISAAGDVGVDIEEERGIPDMDLVARAVFSPAERAAVAATFVEARVRAFYSCWARKEAYIKATGEGVSAGLGHFSVPVSEIESPVRVVDDRSASGSNEWLVRDVSTVPGYASAMVHGSDVRDVRIGRVDSDLITALMTRSTAVAGGA